MSSSLFVRAFIDAGSADSLGDALTIDELAHLRAASIDGSGAQTTVTRLIERMTNQRFNGTLKIETRTTARPTGWFFVEKLVYEREGEAGIMKAVRLKPLSGPVPQDAKPEMEEHDEYLVTRQSAAALFNVDTEYWGEAAIQWLGIGKVSRSEVSPTDCTVTGESSTQVPFSIFKKRVSGKFQGNLESIYKHRKETDRQQPYRAAFNEGGSVNEPEFIKIAKSRTEWRDGISQVERVQNSWVRGIS